MALEQHRNKALESVRQAKDSQLIPHVINWFKAFKEWESKDNFDQAFSSNRMTARMCDMDKMAEFQVSNSAGIRSNMKVNVGMLGIKQRLNPELFMKKKKNEMGMHDLSAVLLTPTKPISKQLFGTLINKYIVFMPLPLEEDLQLFDELSQAAKRDHKSELYGLIVQLRACMTRIKYGSEDDMAVGFLNVTKADNKQHIRYGDAKITGTLIEPDILKQRSVNALYYKSKIAQVQKTTDANNEVTVKYRTHGSGLGADGFPLFGMPQQIEGSSGYSYTVGWGQQKYGVISDEGVYKKTKPI